MASTLILTFRLLALVLLMATSCNGARDLSSTATKLENDGGLESDCWTALANIRSCSDEIIGFFLNGQSHIDRPCCLSLITIAQHCWPALLGSLGYSPEEVSFLQGYCEKVDSDTDLNPSASPSPLFHHP